MFNHSDTFTLGAYKIIFLPRSPLPPPPPFFLLLLLSSFLPTPFVPTVNLCTNRDNYRNHAHFSQDFSPDNLPPSASQRRVSQHARKRSAQLNHQGKLVPVKFRACFDNCRVLLFVSLFTLLYLFVLINRRINICDNYLV